MGQGEEEGPACAGQGRGLGGLRAPAQAQSLATQGASSNAAICNEGPERNNVLHFSTDSLGSIAGQTDHFCSFLHTCYPLQHHYYCHYYVFSSLLRKTRSLLLIITSIITVILRIIMSVITSFFVVIPDD